MSITCVVLNNNLRFVYLLRNYIERSNMLRLIKTYTAGSYALKYLNENSVDVVFVEPSMLGITIQNIKLLDTRPMIVLTSSSVEYAFEGFENNVVDYLMFDATYERFKQMVKKVEERINMKNFYCSPTKQIISILSNYKKIEIPLNNIEYIESMKDYVIIHQNKVKPVMSLMTLKHLLKDLPDEKFRQIHKSYVVPVEKIISIRSRKVKLTGKELPIGKTYSGFVKGWKCLKTNQNNCSKV